ncbi:F19P19.26 [Arabidopsis thaliana]|nr:F19P19.26 [Arabidopsis thaliana]
MAEAVDEDSGVGRSLEESSNGQHSQAGEALSEWRSSGQVENGTPSTSPSYWDIDDDDDYGLKPSELYGQYTWKIPKFSEITKREHRSNVFEAGGYKWYILIYPQGCDVCNHLSLFLCVANYDKLLPGSFAILEAGWSQFAQFTISVLSQDLKKSKFSDTLHRFWKKEHDWGWKKFMELPKLKDGFIDESGCLTIEAKVQVISFGVFWLGMDQNSRRRMCREKVDVILKGVVKHFFVEKEVSSTLVMDSLYSGLKALEGQTKNMKARSRLLDAKQLPAPIVSVDKDMFVLVDDVLLLLERAALEPLPPKDEKGRQNRTKVTMCNMFLYGMPFTKIEVAHQEAIALKRQEELIREEEEAWLAETEQRAKRGAAEREKKSKKKQAKQKRNKNKGKDKRKEEKVSFATHAKDLEENQNQNQNDEEEKDSVTEKAQSSAEKPDTLGDVSDISDSVDGSADILQPDLEDRDSSSVLWDTDALEIHPPSSEGSSRGRGISISTPNGITEGKSHSTMDDSSSTCSNDSIRSGVTNGSYQGNSLNFRNQKSPNKGKNQQVKAMTDAHSLASETDDQPSTLGTDPKGQNYSSEASNVGESDWVVVSHIQEPEGSRNRIPVGRERKTVQSIVNSVDMDRPKEKSTAVLSSPRNVAKNPSPLTQTKPEKKSISTADGIPNRKVLATGPPSSSQVVLPSDIQSQTVGLRADMQKLSAPKQPPATTISRPSSAPIIPAMRPSPITVSSSVQTTTSLPRSVSSAGRLGPDPSLHNQQTYTPQSYKNAIVGNSLGSSSSSFNHHPSSHGVVPTTLPSSSYSQAPTSSYQSSFPYSQDGLLWTGRSPSSVNMGMYNNTYSPAVTSNRSLNHMDVQIAQQQAQSMMTDEFPHLDIINDLLEDEQCSNMVYNGSIFNPQPQDQEFRRGRIALHGTWTIWYRRNDAETVANDEHGLVVASNEEQWNGRWNIISS